MLANEKSVWVTCDQWEACSTAVSPCQAAAGSAELSWDAAVNELSLYSVQYSAVYSVQCSMVWQQRDSHLGPLSAAWLQRMRRSLLSELPSLAPVATDNNINQSPSHLSQRKYILLWRYAGAVFSKILFITHILSKYSCKKSPWKMRPSSIV